jgi:hypothetical protein
MRWVDWSFLRARSAVERRMAPPRSSTTSDVTSQPMARWLSTARTRMRAKHAEGDARDHEAGGASARGDPDDEADGRGEEHAGHDGAA